MDMEAQTLNRQSYPKQKEQCWKLTMSHLKLHNRSIVTNTYQRNTREDQEINHLIDSHLILNKGVKNIHGTGAGKGIFFKQTMLGKLDIQVYKNETRSIPSTLNKNLFQIWVKDNVKP